MDNNNGVMSKDTQDMYGRYLLMLDKLFPQLKANEKASMQLALLGQALDYKNYPFRA